jgi:hypothetical protein
MNAPVPGRLPPDPAPHKRKATASMTYMEVEHGNRSSLQDERGAGQGGG